MPIKKPEKLHFFQSKAFWKSFAQTLIPSVSLLLVFMVLLFIFIPPLIEDQYLSSQRKQLNNLISVAVSIINTQESLERSGKKDRNTAQNDALSRIRAIRYSSDSSGYFWIQNRDSIVISHPLGKVLEWKTVESVSSDYKDVLRQVMEMSDQILISKESAFITYDWYDPETASYRKKMSFLYYYEPWQWVLGTGAFIDDIKDDNNYILFFIITIVIILSTLSFIISLILSITLIKAKIYGESVQSQLVMSEDLIRNKEEQFETIFHVTPFPTIIVKTDNGSIIKANQSFIQMFGFSEEELLNNFPVSLSILADNILSPLLSSTLELNKTMPDKPSIDKPFSSARCKSGEQKVVMISAVPIRFESELCIMIILADFTEQKKTQEQLSQAQKMDTVGQLAGGIAHDFNNMLGGILGSAEVLSYNLDENSSLNQFVQTIIEAAQRASSLTKKLLAFSRRGKLISTPIDVHENLKSAILLLNRSIDKRIDIVENFAADKMMISGDPSLLQNAILNIAINARDAMPRGGTLTFSTYNLIIDKPSLQTGFSLETGMYIVIEISDTGVGIAPENIAKIFDPFFTTKPMGQGTGLGLSAVFGTVKEHRGSIEVYTGLHKGSTFKLYFPVTENNILTGKEPRLSIEKGKGCVLVVDDESIIRNTAYGMLSAMGFDVLLATDGEEAVSIYDKNRNKIDIVILDMVMPKISGKETFYRLKEKNADIKVIFTSGFNPEGFHTDISALEGYPFLQKPYRLCELNKTISHLLSVSG